MNNQKNNKKKFSASKLMVLAVILICVQILVFAEWIMYDTQDISSLYVLIGIPASLAPSLIAYFRKSQAENTKDGIVYDMAMREFDDGVDEEVDDVIEEEMIIEPFTDAEG